MKILSQTIKIADFNIHPFADPEKSKSAQCHGQSAVGSVNLLHPNNPESALESTIWTFHPIWTPLLLQCCVRSFPPQSLLSMWVVPCGWRLPIPYHPEIFFQGNFSHWRSSAFFAAWWRLPFRTTQSQPTKRQKELRDKKWWRSHLPDSSSFPTEISPARIHLKQPGNAVAINSRNEETHTKGTNSSRLCVFLHDGRCRFDKLPNRFGFAIFTEVCLCGLAGFSDLIWGCMKWEKNFEWMKIFRW